nr:unnamed protein product [Callosobruchus analis]
MDLSSLVKGVLAQKRLRREKRLRRRLQDQLDLENKRRAQLEDALRGAGASGQITLINEKISQDQQQQLQKEQQQQHQQQQQQQQQQHHMSTPQHHQAPRHSPQPPPSMERLEMRPIKQEREDPSPAPQHPSPSPSAAQGGYGQGRPEAPPPSMPPVSEAKPWGYAGMEMINTGAAAFWQNYSGKCHPYSACPSHLGGL